VPSEGLLQIVIFMGWLEVIGNKGKYTMTYSTGVGRSKPGPGGRVHHKYSGF